MTSPVHAQLTEADSSGSWYRTVTGKLSFAQTGFQNWQEGGISSLALSSGINGTASRSQGLWNQNHDVRLSFGLVKQDSMAVRKAEDLIQIVSTFTYRGERFLQRFQPTAEVRFRSQFAEGFDYGGEESERVSAFLAPATLTQSVGLTYAFSGYASQRVGLGAKETVVIIGALRERYGVGRDTNVRVEAGLIANTEVNSEIFHNVHLKSALHLFTSFNKPDDAPDILWETLITMKVNTWLNVNFEYVVVYDPDITRALQMKEIFSVGISFVVL